MRILNCYFFRGNYITILGIVLNFETLILIFLKAYTYYPMILQNAPNPFDDVLAGNLFSQFSVAATILLVVVLDLKYYWYFILAGIYGFIEESFLALGIYRHNWYRTWMTVVILPFAFWMAKQMYAKILKGIKPILYYTYIFAGTYYPMILQNAPNPFDDVLAGNLFSQFSVAATILLVVVLDLKYYWYFILAGIYGFIEESFLALGIYRHNWYRTWMTVVILPFAFWMAKQMYAKILKGIKPILYYTYIFAGLFSLYVITLLWGLMLSRLVAFSTTVLDDPISSRYFVVLALFFIPPSFAMMLVYFLRSKWILKVMIVFLLYAVYYTGYSLGLVTVKEGWFLPVSTVTILWVYLSILILDRLYGGLDP